MSVAGHLNNEPLSLSTAVQNSLTVFFQREAKLDFVSSLTWTGHEVLGETVERRARHNVFGAFWPRQRILYQLLPRGNNQKTE
jgi:hypothetical protein